MDISYNKTEVGSFFFALLLMAGLLLMVSLLMPVLTALSLTLVLTYLLHPVASRIEQIVHRRWIAVLFTFIFLMVPFFIFTVIFISTIASQLIELSKTPQMAEITAALGESARAYIPLSTEELKPALTTANLTALKSVFTQGIGAVITFFRALGGVFLQFLLGIFLTVYLLFKIDGIKTTFESIKHAKIKEFFLFLDEGLKQVVYSMILTAAFTGVLAITTYTLFNIPFSLLWGTTTGIVALIPLLGTWLVYLPIGIYLFLAGETFKALLFFTVSLVFVTILPDVAVRPIVASKKVDMGIIILGLITGIMAFGPAGFILGPLIVIAWAGFVRIFLLEDIAETN